ncbi:2-amino-4-hydroxy-6-hydroxymethyldihydropteridine diphosphokinase [Alienimonas sp. DA493]|uniref:2-amino-4-hydroxy-6- hydroxymethyldihydropteridine diphosphokinase n=1 Tax=Alienimonas sp. DA493 TaxID=3373605 RepID=UPI003754ACD5
MNVPALIALGGNTGDVRATFAAALRALDETPGVSMTAASRAYRTPAVGANAGGEFLNAAATLETTLSAHRLLDVLQRLETEAGRERITHWGPRSIDLDLILFGEERIADGSLTVPHPGLAWRRFVLDPACEVAGEWAEPGGVTLREYRERLLARPLRLGVKTEDAGFVAALAGELDDPRRVAVEQWGPGRMSRRRPPTLWLVREDGERGAERTAPTILLPAEPAAAVALLRDVLSAALPDPEPQPDGAPLWPC